MKPTSSKLINRQLGAIVMIVSTLAIAQCAPQQPSPSSAASTSQQTATSGKQVVSVLQSRAGTAQQQVVSSSTSSPISSATGSQATTAASVAKEAQKSPNNSKDSNNKQDAKPTGSVMQNDNEQTNADYASDFYGKSSPFGDDSLWQIPAHLLRDLSSLDATSGQQDSGSEVDGGSEEQMAPQASEPEAGPSAAERASHAPSLEAGLESLEEADDQEDYQPPMQFGPTAAGSAHLATSAAKPAAAVDLKTAAGYHYPSHGSGGHYAGDHHNHHYGDYFQYLSVPKPGAWESGYRRGNPKHEIERHEKAKGSHFQAKVKWTDKHSGYGVHVYDLNHYDNHHHDDHYGGESDHHYAPKHKPEPKHHYYGPHH